MKQDNLNKKEKLIEEYTKKITEILIILKIRKEQIKNLNQKRKKELIMK